MKTYLSFRSLLTTCALCVGLSMTTAHAQLGQQAGFVEAFQPDFLSRDITLMADILEVEDWQQPTIESLLQDYLADFRLGTDGLRDNMKGMRDQILAAGDNGAMAVIMAPINSWLQEKARLKQRFIDNLQSILSEEQQQRWPRLERAMRRDKELPRGVLGGESIDLRQISRDAEVPPDVLLDAAFAVEQYEVLLDAGLLARSKQIERSQDPIKEALIASDYARGLGELELIVAKRVALRDLQEQSIASLAAAYGPQWGEVFRTRALAAMFPMVYRPSAMIPYFAAARDLPGLSADQISQLNALEVDFSKAHQDWQTRFAALRRVEEPKKQTEETRRKMLQGTVNAVKPMGDPYRPMAEERDAADEKARLAIAAIIGPELAAQLPGAPKMAAAANRPMSGGKAGSSEPGLNATTVVPRESNSQSDKALSRPVGGRDRGSAAPKTAE